MHPPETATTDSRSVSEQTAMIGSVSVVDVKISKTQDVLAAHECDWTREGQGLCQCGLVVDTEQQWARHADRALVSALWTPDCECITTAQGLEQLPGGSTILALPGARGRVHRRLVFDDPTLMAWSDLYGTVRAARMLVPAVVLERGLAAHLEVHI